MTIVVDVPDDLASQLVSVGTDPGKAALEALAVEAYCSHRISSYQLRRLLGISTDYELDGILKGRGVSLDYTLEDLDREGEITRRLREQANVPASVNRT